MDELQTVVADDGFFFGLGAFETIAIENGTAVFSDKHLDRLEETLHFLGILCDRAHISQLAKNAIESAAESVGNPVKESFDTIFYKNSSGAKTDIQIPTNRCALKLTATAINQLATIRPNFYDPKQYTQGFDLCISSVLRNETSELTTHKTLNYADNILEKRKALSRGMNEPIFFNTKGHLSEGATTNIFLVSKKDEVLTPNVQSGLLPGIMRNWVLENINNVQECTIERTTLDECEQAFVTNSLLGIMPVRSIDGRKLPRMEYGLEVCKQYFDWVCAGAS